MPTDYQISPYQPVNSLELPGVALQQIIDGEISFGSMRDLAIPSRRQRLTPAEQNSITDSLKEKYGGDNRVLRAIIGAATNPWVLMGFAVSPAGLKAVKETGRIFGFGKLLAGKESGPLSVLGIMTGHQALDGTPLAVIEEKIMHLKRELHIGEQKILEKELRAWSQPGGEGTSVLHSNAKGGVVSNLEEFLDYVTRDLKNPNTGIGVELSSGRITDKMLRLTGREAGNQAERHAYHMVKAFSAAMDRAGRTVTRRVPSIQGVYTKYDPSAKKWVTIDKGEFSRLSKVNEAAVAADDPLEHQLRANFDKHTVVVSETKRAPLMDQRVLEGLVDRYHLLPLIKAQRAQYKDRAVKLFYDEAKYAGHGAPKGTLELDENKMSTLWRSINRSGEQGALWHGASERELAEKTLSAEGIDMIAAIAGPDVVTGLHSSALVGRNFLKSLLGKVVTPMMRDGTYTPRNSFAAAGKEWGGMDTTSLDTLKRVRDSESIAETSRLVPRTAHERMYHPEDHAWMREVNETWGGAAVHTYRAERRMERGINNARANTAEGSETRFLVMNGFESARRYSKKTGDLWSRFIPHYDVDHYMKTGVRAYRPEIYKEVEVLDKDIKEALGARYGEVHHDIPWAEGDKAAGLPPFRSGDTLETIYKNRKQGPLGGVTLADITGTWWG